MSCISRWWTWSCNKDFTWGNNKKRKTVEEKEELDGAMMGMAHWWCNGPLDGAIKVPPEYISGYKGSTTHGVLKSHRSKMSQIKDKQY